MALVKIKIENGDGSVWVEMAADVHYGTCHIVSTEGDGRGLTYRDRNAFEFAVSNMLRAVRDAREKREHPERFTQVGFNRRDMRLLSADECLSEREGLGDGYDGRWTCALDLRGVLGPLREFESNYDAVEVLKKAGVIDASVSEDHEFSCSYFDFASQRDGAEFIARLNQWCVEQAETSRI